MKHNWEYKRLGEICTFIGGGTPSKSNQDYYCGDIPWATVRDMTNFELSKTEHSITQQAVQESATNIIPKNSIVISTHVGLGKICILMQDTAINQDLRGVIFSSPNANKFYFAYWYKSIAEYIIANGHGATVKGVTIDFVKNLQMPVPAMEVQEMIVAELDEINDLIATRKEQIKLLDTLAQSLFYDTFGDPITNPKGWQVKNVADIAKVKIGPFGSLLHKEDYIHGGIPLINPIHMIKGRAVPDLNFTISREKAQDLQNYILKTNDIIFARRGEIGRCALITSQQNGFLCGTGSLYIRFEEKVDPKFSIYYFMSDGISQLLNEKSTGATMLNINCGIVENLPIYFPPLSLQERFASQIEAIESQKAVLEDSLSELQTLLASRMDYWFN